MKKVTDMSATGAKSYFLKSSSYFNLDLPNYFNFDELIKEVSNKINNKPISDYYVDGKNKNPRIFEDVNFKFLHNKDGRYAWRPFQLIHPAIYVDLVNMITDNENWKEIKKRFKEFQKNNNIVCCSLPVESKNKKNDKRTTINNWFSKVEQESLNLALEYDYFACTDITECYSSIYTHTIPWAIHGKEVAKREKNNFSLIGNKIDNSIQSMSFGQTNGIPQGSNLMDFVAEIVLGYGDLLISDELEKNGITDYKILRYRDDYRIYANEITVLNRILKILTEILSSLNLKLNAQKTYISEDIISNSIKKDKMYMLKGTNNDKMNLQQELLFIRNVGIEYPNCGSLLTLLTKIYKEKIFLLKRKPKNVFQLVSLVIDIMVNNPKTYPICSAILSKLLDFQTEIAKTKIISQIKNKISKIPNTDYLDIWLQRLTIIDDRNKQYNSIVCRNLYETVELWNSGWLAFTINLKKIISEETFSNTTKIISVEEVDVFSVSEY